VDSLLFLSGATQSFFVPPLGALALALAGHKKLNRVMGSNQSWNHMGNIAAAIIAMGLVSTLGMTSIFYSAGAWSLLAGASVLLIREKDLDERIAAGFTHEEDASKSSWTYLLKDRKMRWLMLSIFLFHLAKRKLMNASWIYPFIGRCRFPFHAIAHDHGVATWPPRRERAGVAR
jgi:MFS family permease